MTLTLTAFSSAVSWAGQLTVADHGVGAGGEHHLAQLLGLPRADVGGRVGFVAALDEALEHLRTGGLCERGQLGEAGVGVGGAAVGPDTDQHDAFQSQLAVFHLGDVASSVDSPATRRMRCGLRGRVRPLWVALAGEVG